MTDTILKTVFFVATVLGGASLSVATSSAPSYKIGGFSAALQGGYATQNTKFDAKYVNGATNRSTSSDMSGDGGVVGLNLGYDYVFKNRFLLGLTLHGELSSLKGKTGNAFPPLSDGYTELKQKHAFGAYARLGYVYHRVIPFIKLGYSNSKFDATSKDMLAGLGSNKVSKNLSGFQGGLGCEVLFNRAWSMLGEYTYSVYEKISYPGLLNDGTKTSDIQIKPQTNTFMLKLKYRFNA